MKRYDPRDRLLIAIAIIAVVVGFAGCVEEETPAPAPSPTAISIQKTTPTPAPTAPFTVTPTVALAPISEDDLTAARDHYLHHDYCRHTCNGNKACYDECMEYYEPRNHSDDSIIVVATMTIRDGRAVTGSVQER